MNRSTLSVVVAAMLLPSAAFAQNADIAVESDGYRVGDSGMFQPHAGFEAGVVSNVFYTEADEVTSGIARLIAGFTLETTGAGAEGGADVEPSGRDLEYSTRLELAYDEYLSSNEDARSQRDLGIDGNASVTLLASRPTSFYVTDNFTRSTRSPNFETSGTLARDVNRLRLGLRWRPPGRTLSGHVRYQNVIDRFESGDIAFANRHQHSALAELEWRYLPVTKFYVRAEQGFYSALGEADFMGAPFTVGSFPLHARVGLDTAITELTAVRLHFGWAVGFYDQGASYNSPIYGASFSYRYSPFGRVRLDFLREFRDSINANFYGDYTLRASVKQQIGRLGLVADASLIFRGYEGIPLSVSMESTRSDTVVGVGAEGTFMVRRWLAITGSYRMSSVSTDFRYIPPESTQADDPGYVRQEVLVGARAAF